MATVFRFKAWESEGEFPCPVCAQPGRVLWSIGVGPNGHKKSNVADVMESRVEHECDTAAAMRRVFPFPPVASR